MGTPSDRQIAAEASLLVRFVPIVLADDGDRFELDAIHACIAGRWCSYWLAWSGDRDHSGADWELVMVRAGDDGVPVEAVYAYHRSAERRPWGKVPVEGERPVVFAERGKHASRFRDGWHRHGLHLSRANGKRRLDPPLMYGVPPEVESRLAHRDPDTWLRSLGR